MKNQTDISSASDYFGKYKSSDKKVTVHTLLPDPPGYNQQGCESISVQENGDAAQSDVP